MRRIKVLKFGGTSMGSADAIKKVIKIIRTPRRDAKIAAVIVSAMSGATDQLIAIARFAAKKDKSYKKSLRDLKNRHLSTIDELMEEKNSAEIRRTVTSLFDDLESAVENIARQHELSGSTLDYVMSFGERLSAHVLTAALNERGSAAEYLNARHIIVTDRHFGAAKVDFAATEKTTRSYFKKHKKLQVVTGFIGSAPGEKITTLGRGGSDYSAAIVGAVLGAKVIEIWTDVSGIFSANPKLVPKAKVVPELAFEEAGELAYFGAKVLHPKTILPAMREGIPVKVLNTFAPQDTGTTIVTSFDERRLKSHNVEALTYKAPVLAIHVRSPEFFDVNGFIARIFEIFDLYRTSIDVVTTSVTGVSVTVENEKNLPKIIREIKKLGDVSIDRRKAIICVVGGGINTAGIAGRMFSVLGEHNIPVEMISQESTGVSITFVVAARDAKKVLKILHKEYIR